MPSRDILVSEVTIDVAPVKKSCHLYKTLEEKELSTIERKTKIREIYCQALFCIVEKCG